MYSMYNQRGNFVKPIYRNIYRGGDDRNLLFPLLFGAAVGFPFGYIASNTNKNQNYPYPYYPQPYPMYPMYPPQYPYPPMPY